MMMETSTKRANRLSGQFVVGVPASKIKCPSDCFQFVNDNQKTRYLESAPLSELGRGGNWADGSAGYSLAQSILPPNSPSCAIEATSMAEGYFSASSRHEGGCHVLMCDGAVAYITNSIDTGDLTTVPTTDSQSPYGVWGAIGTAAGEEGDVGFDPFAQPW